MGQLFRFPRDKIEKYHSKCTPDNSESPHQNQYQYSISMNDILPSFETGNLEQCDYCCKHCMICKEYIIKIHLSSLLVIDEITLCIID